MAIASPPGDPGGTFFFRSRPQPRLPRRFLLHISLGLLLWLAFLAIVPPFSRRPALVPTGLLIGCPFGCSLAAYLVGALFLAGRRRANRRVTTVPEFLSGLDEVERRRRLAEGYRRPCVRAFFRNVLREGIFLLYSLSLWLGGIAGLGLLTYGILRARGIGT